MKLLAKSALKTDQIKARKDLKADGIELILSGQDVIDSGKSVDTLAALADDWPVIGLEVPDSFNGVPVDPTSRNKGVREDSQRFLQAAVDIACNVAGRANVEVYLQYQCLFDNQFDDNGTPSAFGWAPVLGKIREFHGELAAKAFPLKVQLENTVPVSCLVGGNRYHCFATTRPRDFKWMDVPLAFNIAHYAQALYTWVNVKSTRQRIVKDDAKNLKDNSNVYAVTPDDRKYVIGMTKADVRYGNLLQKNSLKEDVKAAITKEIINVIYAHKMLIGSVQFSDCLPGFGTEDCEAGYFGDKGMIDVPAVLRAVFDAKIPASDDRYEPFVPAIPFIIPKYKEQDYNNPVNQKKAFELVREIMATAGSRKNGT